jgi:hypothetical protein
MEPLRRGLFSFIWLPGYEDVPVGLLGENLHQGKSSEAGGRNE